ncbi:MAG: hypothetical protein ACRDXX_16910 [Stackebrandtia sp.]
MGTPKIDDDPRTRTWLKAIADVRGVSMDGAVDWLITRHKERQARVNYEQLKAEPEEWASLLAERERSERTALYALRQQLASERPAQKCACSQATKTI